MRKKSGFIFIMIIILSFVLAACGSSDDVDSEGNSSGDNEGTVLTVATVNNPDMKIMQKLTKEYFEEETGISVEFVELPENDLRKKVTEDVALGDGAFDIVTISTYDTPIWAQNDWIETLSPQLDALSDEEKEAYDLEDIFPTMRYALTHEDDLYALPFYGESTMLYYNKEIFEEVGLEMPLHPTWDEVGEMARTIKDATGTAGIVLRGLPGWGEMMAPVTTMINAFGGCYYDEDWNAQLDSENTLDAINFYVDLLDDAGQPGATSTGFTEALTMMSTGKAAMWYDATVAAGFLDNPDDSDVVGKIGYAFAPTQEKEENTGGLYAWSLAIESASKNKDAAFEFIKWSTSKEYIELVGEEEGWVVVPSGTRISTYENEQYQEAAPFSDMVLESILSVDYDNPAVYPVPYVGAQYVAIPEFQSLGMEVSQQIAAAISGDKSVADAMKEAQKLAEEAAEDGDYK